MCDGKKRKLGGKLFALIDLTLFKWFIVFYSFITHKRIIYGLIPFYTIHILMLNFIKYNEQ